MGVALPIGQPEGVEITDEGLDLVWPTGRVSLPALWLRDNCACHDCRHHETGEHWVLVARGPAKIAAHEVSHDADGLRVVWDGGHVGIYPWSWFEHIARLDAVQRLEPVSWFADHTLLRVPHGDLVGDPSVQLEAFEELARHGAIVVTGTPAEFGEVERFLECIGVPVRETPFDRIHDVYMNPQGYNVAHTDYALPPHNDFASYQWNPSGQLLHFLVNDAAGGNSLLVDGFAAVERLRAEAPAAVELLATVPVGFREFSSTAESFTRAPILRTDHEGLVQGVRFSNQLMQPLSWTEPRLAEWYDAYHLFGRILEDPAHQIEFRCNAGDMQMVHGHRVLHGRRAFEAGTGARHLQDTYFEIQDVFGRLARLRGELTG